MRLSYALINRSNLKYNFLNIRKKVKDVKIMAVVKADAYGHGVIEIVKTLNSLGNKKPDYYGVAILEEAMELRKHGVTEPILVFNPVMEHDSEIFSRYNLIASVFNEKHLAILKKANHLQNRKIKVHVKVDTGMHRLGINFTEALEFISKLHRNEAFEIDGIYTHFANADEKKDPYPILQLNRFIDILRRLKEQNIPHGLAHAANSSAILNFHGSWFDMVRPGLLMFGYSPAGRKPVGISLKPVMSLISYIDSIKEIEKGESISYSRTYFTSEATRIATVPIGYADGYNRKLSNKAKAIINGSFFNQVGNVTMDRIMFNIDAANCRIGDKVILMGNDKDLEFNIWDWSKIIDTIPYEVICNISKRIPRIYKS